MNSGEKDEIFAVYQQGKINESESKALAKSIMDNIITMDIASESVRQVKGYTRFNTLGVLNNFKGRAGVLIELGGIGSEDNRNESADYW